MQNHAMQNRTPQVSSTAHYEKGFTDSKQNGDNNNDADNIDDDQCADVHNDKHMNTQSYAARTKSISASISESSDENEDNSRYIDAVLSNTRKGSRELEMHKETFREVQTLFINLSLHAYPNRRYNYNCNCHHKCHHHRVSVTEMQPMK